MAVVTKYSSSSPDPSLYKQPKGQDTKGRTVSGGGSIAIANGDSATSVIYLQKIPTSARIKASSTIYHPAVTSLTDVDIGFEEDPDALADGLNLSSAGTKVLNAVVSSANLHKKVWELAGYASDPGKEIWIIMTLKVDSGAAGVVFYDLEYITAA